MIRKYSNKSHIYRAELKTRTVESDLKMAQIKMAPANSWGHFFIEELLGFIIIKPTQLKLF